MNKILFLSLMLLLASCADNPVDSSKTVRDLSSAETKGVEDEDPWTTWSRTKGQIGGLLVLSKIRKNLLKNNIHDPYVSYGFSDAKCDEARKYYRSADGTCTDWDQPAVGAANTAFGRNVPPEYIGNESPEQLMTPNPRVVSEVFFTRKGKKTDYKKVPFLNMLAASWIQFMNHDWVTHGENQKGKHYKMGHPRKKAHYVEKTQADKTDRSFYKEEFKKTSLNKVTHWWDASQLYGSNLEQQKKVRVSEFVNVDYVSLGYENLDFGKMKMTEGGLLPKRGDLNVRRNRANEGYELTGFSDNWWVGLSMLHNLFVKEHNAIVSHLTEKYVKWDTDKQKWRWDSRSGGQRFVDFWVPGSRVRYMNNEELDEHLFQLGRLINAAVLAKIHTIEWTPAILANETLKKGMFANWYGLANAQTVTKVLKHIPGLNKTDWFKFNTGYILGGIVGNKKRDYGVPYSLTEEFTSVYRLHSLIPEELELKKLKVVDGKKKGKKDVVVTSSKNIHVNETRNEKSYGLTEDYGMNELFYSFGKQLPGQLVLNNFPRFMQNIDLPTVGKMDLGAIDILRDRERGVPRYNQLRRAIGLKPIKSYRDFFPAGQELNDAQKKTLANFKKVYGLNEDGSDNVDSIDLLVGSLAEEVRPKAPGDEYGFGFGETMFQIFIVMASRRLMADRFYTEDYNKNVYTKAGLKWIDHEGFLHKIIGRHMPELKPKMKGLETAFAPWNE